jgi:hypothetical protein
LPPPWLFSVLDAAELVVLLPQIGFNELSRGQVLENGHVSLRETADTLLGEGR